MYLFFSAQSFASAGVKKLASLISGSLIKDVTEYGSTTEITRLLDSVTDVDTNDAVSRSIATKRLLIML